MKAYYINLDRRPDRVAHMADQCSKLNLKIERVSAVDCLDPVVVAEAALAPPNHWGRLMNVQTYACLQSHRKVWQQIVASGASHGMVLEDDVLLAPDIGIYLQDSWVPADADLVKLETKGWRVHLARAETPVPGGRHLRRMRSFHYGSGCYVVSAKAASRLLSETAVTGDAVDVILFSDDLPYFSDELPYFATAMIYQMKPAPATQGSLCIDKPSWSISDIAMPAESPSAKARETLVQRATRRLYNEIKARIMGTSYICVAHG